MKAESENLFTISGLSKEYGEGGAKVIALKNINLSIPVGKFIVILGASGSGKSTFLNMLGCMDRPTKGNIRFFRTDITAFNKRQMTAFRAEHIGFVFQSYNLLPDLTALENVEFSTELSGLSRSEAKKALEMVGLSERMSHYPAQLSGGEQQRVSIARAIAKHPKVLLCDEPTGALDFKTGLMVLDVLKRIHHEKKSSVLLITHNLEIAKIADMVITLGSGEIQSITETDSESESESETKIESESTQDVSNESIDLPAHDTTQVASHDREYTVIFWKPDGSGVPFATVTGVSHAEKIFNPGVPIKSGYRFVGWFKDTGYTESWDFENDMVTEDTWLFAKQIVSVRVID